MYLKPAVQSSDYLMNLINDILDYTEINVKNNILLNIQPVPIADLTQEIEQTFKINCNVRNIDLKFDIPSFTVPKEIWTDKKRIKQIMLNLIGNALKFTLKGSITVIFGYELR